MSAEQTTEEIEDWDDDIEDWDDDIEDDEPEPESEDREPAEVLRRPMMSGWCAHPSVTDGFDSHARCTGGQRANPAKQFTPCPCACHLGETYECSGCGRDIREAPLWPLDEDGDMRYTHIDTKDGRAIGEECA